MQDSIKINNENYIVPNPAIQQNIIKRIKSIHSKKNKMLESYWNNLKNMLEYRIPVYQALSSFALILLIIVGVFHFTSSINPQSFEKQSYAPVDTLETILYRQIGVINNLEMINNQKLGLNVREDSILARYVIPAM